MERKPILVVMVGIPGSGKSTIANELSKQYGMRVFSSDKIREEFYGDANIQGDAMKVFGTLYYRMSKALQSGQDCIFDATNVNKKDRSGVFKRIHCDTEYDVVAYVVMTNVDECIRRDALRDRHATEAVIQKFVNKFTMPSAEEGFDDVFINNSQSEIDRFHAFIKREKTIVQNPKDDLILV